MPSGNPKKKKRKIYSPAQMDRALRLVRDGGVSRKRAASLCGVPRTTLLDKLAGRVPDDKKPGPSTILKTAEEKILVTYICRMADIGYPLTRAEVLQQVKRILDLDGRKTPFPQNLPGKGWYRLFRNRHPSLTERKPQHLGRERAVININMIQGWFDGLFDFLRKEVPNHQDIIADPSRIFNADESGFPLCISSNRVLTTKGAKHVYQVVANNKTQITVMACMNAIGDYMPPMIVFPGQRLRNINLQDFEEAIYGLSLNGWMDSDLFLEFLKSFVSFVRLRNIPFPVILFVDGHSTHIGLASATFCAQNRIILYCLLPHATHILQACDIGLFSPMKAAWQRNVKAWQMQHMDEVFTKLQFPQVFRKTWMEVTTLSNSVNAFRRSGLFPLNVNSIDKTKLQPSDLARPSDHIQAVPVEIIEDDPVENIESNPVEIIEADPVGNIEANPPENIPVTIQVFADVHRNPEEDEVAPAFNMLHLPVPKQKKSRNVIKKKLPKAISGTEAIKLLREREEEKQKEEEDKQKRKEEREAKRKTKLENEARKKEEKEKKKKEKGLSRKKKSTILDDIEDPDDLEQCAGCGRPGGRPSEWAGCDRCEAWWHIRCITDPTFHLHLSASNANNVDFTCALCKDED